MLPDPGSLRQVEGQKGPPLPPQRDGIDAVHARRSQKGQRVEEDKEQQGNEDADPRWSHRKLILERIDVPPPAGPALHLAADATDFRGQPGDPFAVLIKQREERRKKAKRATPEIAIKVRTGLGVLDDALDELDARLYAICGPAEAAKALAHQIACHVAADLPVVYVSYGVAARDLTLQALARLAGDRLPGDLARAREVADRFRPIRENLAIVEATAEDTVPRLRARLQQIMVRRQVKHGLLAISDLRKLALPFEQPELKPWQKAVQAKAPPGEQDAKIPPVGGDSPRALIATAHDLSQLAYHLGVPVLAVVQADPLASEEAWPADLPEPVRLILSEPAKDTGAVTVTVHKPQVRQLRPRGAIPEPPAVKLAYQAKRAAFRAPEAD